MNKNIQYKKLTDICEIITGEWGTEISENSQNIVSVIRTTNFLNNGKIDIENRELIKREIDKNKIEQKQLKKGDIIIEKSGGSPNQPVGRVVFFSLNSNEVFLCNNFTSILRVKEDINSKYIFYFLRNNYKNKKVLKFQNKTTGIINLKLQNYLNESCIFLPELKIQNKIVNILDNLENIIEKNQNYLTHLGVLTKSLFTKYSIGEKESIANLCYIKARIGWQGLTKKEYLSNGKYYLITGVDFKNEKIDFKNCFYVTKERYNQDENIKVKINDILLTKDGTIGKVAIVDKLEKPATLNSGVFVLRPKVNNLNVTYLMHSLISEDFKKFIDDIKIGATVPHLNQAALLKYKLILPPIELQNKFAERVEKIEKLKFEIEKSIEIAQNLYDSLISKYFDN